MKPQDFAELRHRAGLTQSSVAAELGETSGTIASWESPESDKNFSDLEHVSPGESGRPSQQLMPTKMGEEVRMSHLIDRDS